MHLPLATLALTVALGGGASAQGAVGPRPLDELARSERALAAAVRRRVPDWSPEADALRSQVERLLAGIIDYEGMARRALGPAWDGLTDSQRRAFVGVFSELTNQAFVAARTRPGVSVRFDSETVVGPEASVLATVELLRAARPVEEEVEYRLTKRSDRWLINDVLVDQVSLIAAYQADFTRLLRRGGFDGLMQRMRRKAEMQRPR